MNIWNNFWIVITLYSWYVDDSNSHNLYFFEEKKKTFGKFYSKMLLGFTGQEFWSEYNVGIFAPNLVDSIFGGPINIWKNLLKNKKKKSIQFCSEIPLGPLRQECWPENKLMILHDNLQISHLEVQEANVKRFCKKK